MQKKLFLLGLEPFRVPSRFPIGYDIGLEGYPNQDLHLNLIMEALQGGGGLIGVDPRT